jgi:DNA helicase II / ATP-dependent DNA helicase PcrA
MAPDGDDQHHPDGAPVARRPSRPDLLEGLNPVQREVVTHLEGPLLVVAGAGSGKTRVLTHRIAHLIRDHDVSPFAVLAITFTNKAADEMKDRVAALVGPVARRMWVSTFHSACSRILRREATHLGMRSTFSIYDQSDAQRLVGYVVRDKNLDPKRFAPRQLHATISALKNDLVSAEQYAQMASGPHERRVAEVFTEYQRRLVEASALDFDDLLVSTVRLLQDHPDVLHRWRSRFLHVMVDEFQDTNAAQWELIRLLGSEHRNVMVVGDADQCLAAGTAITMGDGSRRPIELVRVGDEVLSNFGSGDLRPAAVTRVHRARAGAGIEIRTARGRRITSTPEHVHLAGFIAGRTPQLHMTYLMYKAGHGYRVGTSRTYTNGRTSALLGPIQRCRQEHGDAMWITSVHETEAEARWHEAVLAAAYGLPTVPFVARRRSGISSNGLVGDQRLLDRLFERIDTEKGALRLLVDEGLRIDQPHWSPSTSTVSGRTLDRPRRRLSVTLCGDRRGARALHRLSLTGSDDVGRRALVDLGLSVRPARSDGRGGWRCELTCSDLARIEEAIERIRSVLDVTVRATARIGRNEPGSSLTNSLPFTAASAVRPGMVVVDAEGGYDVVASVEHVPLDGWVHDLDVAGTHNYVANDLVTHNSVYRFRGADHRNLMRFEDEFTDATVIILEQNYRSSQVILEAANAVIANNPSRRAKNLWTEQIGGELITHYQGDDEGDEAQFIIGEITRLGDTEGARYGDVAVFYRTNAQSRVLEEALVRQGVPYRVVGGTKFYDRREIKDVLAYLRALTNPDDEVSVKRVLNVPKRGVGDTSVAKVEALARDSGVAFADALGSAAAAGVSGKALGGIADYLSVLAELRHAAEGGVAVTVERLLDRTGYVAELEAERSVEAAGRIENLRELVGVAAQFDEQVDRGDLVGAAAGAIAAAQGADYDPESGASITTALDPPTGLARLQAFLEAVSLVTDLDGIDDDQSQVTLMTLHSAKGLEFPIVFLTGMEEGVFPHIRALGDPDELEEERRLCYVGITRAEERLYLCHAWSRSLFGATQYNPPSRFLAEIPEELLRRAGQAGRSRSGNHRDRVVAAAFRDAGRWRSDAGGGSGGASGGGGGAGNRPAGVVGARGAERIGLRVGDDVTHEKYGAGVIVDIVGEGDKAEASVNFPDHGQKRLLLAWAPLRKA